MNAKSNDFSAERVVELYNENKYDELIGLKYESTLKNGVRVKSKFFAEDFITMKFLCFATYMAGYYYDCLILIKKLFEYVPCNESIYQPIDKVYFAECALESLWYCYINGINEDWDHKRLIDGILTSAPAYYDNIQQKEKPLYDKVKNIYDLCQNGMTPYYNVSFFVPFTLNFNKHTFDLKSAPPFKDMVAEREIRGNVEGTKFTISIEGFVKADSWWKGPVWDKRQDLYVAIPALNMVNRLLLIIAEGDSKDFVPRIRPKQLSSIDIQQFMGDGQLYHACIGTMFNAHFIKRWFQSPPYEIDELEKLNRLLIETSKYPLYATLYHRAQNTMHAGLYEESFMLFCSCTEAIIHYWCRQLSRVNGIEQEYEDFEREKPVCERCSHYQIDPNAVGVSKSVMPPVIYKYFDFLSNNSIINSSQKKTFLKLLNQSRNDKLRNGLMHGKIGLVEYSQVKKCQDAIFSMNETFIEVMNKYGSVDNSSL